MKLLYFLSKTDSELIARCDESSKRQQLVKGLSVLVTALTTGVAMLYLPLIVLDSIALAIVIAVSSAVFSILFLREIVSGVTRSKVLMAIPVALVMAALVSVPVQLRLFQKDISAEITKNQSIERERQIDQRKAEIASIRKKREELQSQLIAEEVGRDGSGVSGHGPVYQVKLKIYEEYSASSEERMRQLNLEIQRIEQDRAFVVSSEKPGLLQQIVTLQKIHSEHPTAYWLTLLIILAFVLIEFFPITITLLERRTMYTELEVQEFSSSAAGHLRQRRAPQTFKSTARSNLRIPTFSVGFASAIDWTGELGPSLNELHRGATDHNESDARALAGDWQNIRDDLKIVFERHAAKSTR